MESIVTALGTIPIIARIEIWNDPKSRSSRKRKKKKVFVARAQDQSELDVFLEARWRAMDRPFVFGCHLSLVVQRRAQYVE